MSDVGLLGLLTVTGLALLFVWTPRQRQFLRAISGTLVAAAVVSAVLIVVGR